MPLIPGLEATGRVWRAKRPTARQPSALARALAGGAIPALRRFDAGDRELAGALRPLPREDLGAAAARSGRPLPGSMLADPVFRSKLERAGVTPDYSGGLVGQFGRDIVSTAVGVPAGLAASFEAIGKDAAASVRERRPTLRNTGRIAEATRGMLVEDMRHPLRRPGLTFLDLLAVGSAGAIGAARVPALAGRVAANLRAGSAARAARAASGQRLTGAQVAKKLGRSYVKGYVEMGKAAGRAVSPAHQLDRMQRHLSRDEPLRPLYGTSYVAGTTRTLSNRERAVEELRRQQAARAAAGRYPKRRG